MNVQLIASAAKDFEELSPRLRKTILKQLELLCQDLRHPSIRAKKYDESKDVWRGRVNQDFCFIFALLVPPTASSASFRTRSWEMSAPGGPLLGVGQQLSAGDRRPIAR